jgi:glycosyltransferase involved in cell wall biosynthesis
VLSWSMLEAMSTGCLVIASNTPPVTEIIPDGVNDILVDFFSPEQIASRVEEALDNPDRMKPIRLQARQTILAKYDLADLLPRHLKWMQENANIG